VLTFTGTITTNAAGTVSYHWLRSDGASTSPDDTLTFGGAATKTATTTWSVPQDPPPQVMRNPSIFESFLSLFEGRASAVQLGTPYGERVVVTSPNAISSNEATSYRSLCVN
jgi:hypothetical protein